ncbi:helix-turn-helix transcriptional regulator [bacterium]|nr:helix-turn-helix transcriptional regulator [bacterium]
MVNEIQTIFISNLKKLRGEAGLTQAALAEKCALSAYYVTEIETGRRFPSLDTLQKLCDVLDVRPYRLFFSEKDSLQFIDEVRDELYLGKLKKGIDEVFEQFR